MQSNRRLFKFFKCALLLVFCIVMPSSCTSAHKQHKKRVHKEQKAAAEARVQGIKLAHFLNNVPPAPWMLEQIAEDLAPFQVSGVSISAMDQLIAEDHSQGSPKLFVRYKISNHRVEMIDHVSDHPCALPRSKVIAEALKKLAEAVELPDLDFIVTMHDSLDQEQLPAPVFAFAKNPKYSPQIVLMPDFEALEGRKRMIGKVNKANAKYPWSKKINQAVWRGSRTGGDFTLENFLSFPRSKTIELSLKFPELINARFGDYAFSPEVQRQAYAPFFGDTLPMQSHIQYKYQLLIDGNSCAYSGGFWRLFSNSVVLKQASDSVQWYYRALQPYIHFIPINADMSNLVEMIQWALNHDAEAEQISTRAQAFAQENLHDFRILQYLHQLLLEYSKLPHKT